MLDPLAASTIRGALNNSAYCGWKEEVAAIISKQCKARQGKARQGGSGQGRIRCAYSAVCSMDPDGPRDKTRLPRRLTSRRKLE